MVYPYKDIPIARAKTRATRLNRASFYFAKPFVSTCRRPSNRCGARTELTPFVPDAFQIATERGAVKETSEAAP
jgi:hypothetical protein